MALESRLFWRLYVKIRGRAGNQIEKNSYLEELSTCNQTDYI